MHLPGHKKGLVTAKDVPEPIKEEAPGPAASQVAEPLAAEKPPLPPPNEEAPPPLSPEEPQVIILCLFSHVNFVNTCVKNGCIFSCAQVPVKFYF